MAEMIMLGLIVYFIWYYNEAKKLAAREEEAKKAVKQSKRKETWMTNFKGDDK
jgi:high-affinity Fe2+/Pb2+ permease